STTLSVWSRPTSGTGTRSTSARRTRATTPPRRAKPLGTTPQEPSPKRANPPRSSPPEPGATANHRTFFHRAPQGRGRGHQMRASTDTGAGASILHQPRAVWAVAFAAVIAFMGIGLVDPILPAISAELDATPAQSMLLFTSYLFITGGMMFFTSYLSSRIGAKTTLLVGLVLIVAFSALAGFSGTVDQIIGFRAGWGLGNALFISTALSTIVGAASGGADKAIILYEAALGVGIATGPLLGGLLGGISWRGPFFGTAVLMAIGF